MPSCLDTLRNRFKKITPIPDITMVTSLCYLLECLLTPVNTPPDCSKELYELYFVFAAVWAFGGAMFQDQVRRARSFSSSILLKNYQIVFPLQDCVVLLLGYCSSRTDEKELSSRWVFFYHFLKLGNVRSVG